VNIGVSLSDEGASLSVVYRPIKTIFLINAFRFLKVFFLGGGGGVLWGAFFSFFVREVERGGGGGWLGENI